MEFLKRSNLKDRFVSLLWANVFVTLSLIFSLASCAPLDTFVDVVTLETDTYISNQNSINHSEERRLKVTRRAGLEEKTILRFPTTEVDPVDGTDFEIFDGFLFIFFMPMYMMAAILTSCSEYDLHSENLQSAVLRLDYDEMVDLGAADLRLDDLAGPWWHTVSWNEAHPFSDSGTWQTPGGDINGDQDSLYGQNDDGESLEFDITEYFKKAIDNGGIYHYGFLITAEIEGNASFHSIQSSTASSPRVIAEYDVSGQTLCTQDNGGVFNFIRVTTRFGGGPQVIDYIE